jgi:hypothetical protein
MVTRSLESLALSIERVEKVYDLSQNLHMPSAAVPIRDLRVLLDFCRMSGLNGRTRAGPAARR